MTSVNDRQQSAGKLALLEGQGIHPWFVNLLMWLTRLGKIPQNMTETDRNEHLAYARDNLPPIWLTWPFLVLMYFRSRIKWARSLRPTLVYAFEQDDESVTPDESCLRGEGHFPHDDPEWEYRIRGDVTHMNNIETGEWISVWPGADDALPSDESVEYAIDHTRGIYPYQRGSELFPCTDGITVAFDLFEKQFGVLIPGESECATLHPAIVEFQGECDNFFEQLRLFPDAYRYIAVALGDCEYLKEFDQSADIERWASEFRQQWLSILRAEADQGLSRELVYALADADGLDPYLPVALSNPASVSAAVYFVFEDPQWCDQVSAAIQQSERFPNNCANYLVKHGYHAEEFLKKLVASYHSEWPHRHYQRAVELSLSHAPHLTSEFLREGLRSNSPTNREVAAVVLALIDKPWGWNEQVSVLSESDDWKGTAEARNLLRASGSSTMQALVDSWESEHRETRPSGDRGEVSLAAVISEWSDKVLPVRDQIPDPTA